MNRIKATFKDVLIVCTLLTIFWVHAEYVLPSRFSVLGNISVGGIVITFIIFRFNLVKR
jgi:hypothetical protein